MNKIGNGMNDKQSEILCITQEECAEVTQVISKIFRFGMESKHPNDLLNNRERLEEEIGDLHAMIDLMIENKIIFNDKIDIARKAKYEKLKRWSKIMD